MTNSNDTESEDDFESWSSSSSDTVVEEFFISNEVNFEIEETKFPSDVMVSGKTKWDKMLQSR